jgi:formamidopyrimidine-DNA glycosylase
MPELAEVFYYAHRWETGLRQKIVQVDCHPSARIYRAIPAEVMAESLVGQQLRQIETRGKQMRFLFSGAIQLGLHLGMTGELRTEAADYVAAKADHLVLRQKKQSLVFRDPRMFGCLRWHVGKEEALWWQKLPPEIGSPEFTLEVVADFLRRRGKAPLKAVLLMQEKFSGVGNWMADEILWRARLSPARRSGNLTPAEVKAVWKETRWVAQKALATIGRTCEDPPASWLFPHRWKGGGVCPRCQSDLSRKEIGGRTTCWCARCQPGES